MECPRCKEKTFHVLKSYTEGRVRTQSRRCSKCGHFGTTVVMHYDGEESAWQLAKRLAESAKKTDEEQS